MYVEEFASYVQNVASKHNSRLININEKINSMQSLALIKNEKRNNLKIGLYFLISHNYKIVLKRNAKGNRKYQIVTEDKKLLCLRSTVHENDKKLKALFNGDHYKVTPAALFRLSIALSLTFEDAYDWYLAWGYDLSSDAYQCEEFAKLLRKYCIKSGHSLEVSDVHERLYQADLYSQIHHLGALYPRDRNKK